MRFHFPVLALFWAGAFAPTFLSATSIIPFANLGEATTYSECVVLARAMETFETLENGTAFHDTRFESLESVKGQLAVGTVFSIRALSCRSGGFNLDIAGDFAPQAGKTYLLFLYKKGEVWQPLMLSFYVFEQFDVDGNKFLVPVGDEGIELVARPDGQLAEPLGVFSQDVFLQHLRAFAASQNSLWDGGIGRSVLRKEDFEASDRSIPTGCDFALGANICRWQDAAIPVYYDDTSNPSGWAGIFSNTLSAMNSNYTGIDPSDAGSASYTPNCGGGSAYQGNFTDFCDDELNGTQSTLIIFEDPCNEIANLNNCAGTLAIGGGYSSSSTHQFDGQTWNNALYGFVVVNNGVADCLDETEYERMMTHELTHTYHMDHLNATNYPNQNMNPTCCNAINTKDRECMNYAYPPPLPVELTSFEARLHGKRQVKLNWATQSEKDNAHFTLQRSPNGTVYAPVQQIPSTGNSNGGAYEWVDARPLVGVNYYLLSQTDFDGTVQHLGIKAVTVGGIANALRISPNPVAGETLVFSMELSDDFEGTLEVLGTDGRVVSSAALALEKGVWPLQQPLGKIPAGIYLLRLRGGQEQWAVRFLRK